MTTTERTLSTEVQTGTRFAHEAARAPRTTLMKAWPGVGLLGRFDSDRASSLIAVGESS